MSGKTVKEHSAHLLGLFNAMNASVREAECKKAEFRLEVEKSLADVEAPLGYGFDIHDSCELRPSAEIKPPKAKG